ncbi:chromophore lyase CpcT/CpeT [cf. Phormidesmis sp. LEGE 11477]|uniref:chromophore lyase CpcT/CpeT n=1 Tax=cf. Phormidesmis sp. LEGE 11477 TaxID=1828680 RepID=UPI00187EAB6E|nr:chromophore lyase CpcT/CpeT [cf. Phormidesmis sp. LEGE 11477]MBE9060206.1 chromophore lyase CpcT/CpeT [cf. Phormidesmis sp. LEGE 11477]
MTHPTDVATLTQWMAAEFSNQAQAFENPPFFAHIKVCMRPLPKGFQSGVSLYLEQAYSFQLDKPYRVRVLHFIQRENDVLLENYKVKDEEKFYGAARDLEKLATLSADDLEPMNGCDIFVEWTGESFRGKVEPGKKCSVVRKGATTYLDNEFIVTESHMTSYDRGRDPETDELVWGSVAGPFEFDKVARFAHEVQV